MSNVSYLITMPIYKDLPHIAENLESVNDWEHLLIVDNSADSFCKKFEGKGAKIEYRPINIGVSRAWNLGIAEGKDYTFFVSSSVKFNKGFKELVDHLEKLIAENVPLEITEDGSATVFESNNIEWGLFTQLGWHCNGISKKTVEKIGIFDQNMYPAYYEDTDYCRRLKLAGIHDDENHVPCVVLDAKPIGTGVSLSMGGLQVNFAGIAEYYKQKWGGFPGEETSEKPFGCPLLRFWPKADIDELIERYKQ